MLIFVLAKVIPKFACKLSQTSSADFWPKFFNSNKSSLEYFNSALKLWTLARFNALYARTDNNKSANKTLSNPLDASDSSTTTADWEEIIELTLKDEKSVSNVEIAILMAVNGY